MRSADRIAQLKELNSLLRRALEQCKRLIAEAEQDSLAETGQDNEPERIKRQS